MPIQGLEEVKLGAVSVKKGKSCRSVRSVPTVACEKQVSCRDVTYSDLHSIVCNSEFAVGKTASVNTETVRMTGRSEINPQNKDLNASKKVSVNFINT